MGKRKPREAVVKVIDHGIYREIFVDPKAPPDARLRAIAGQLPLPACGWADLSRDLNPAERLKLLSDHLKEMVDSAKSPFARDAGLEQAAGVLAILDALEKAVPPRTIQDCDVFLLGINAGFLLGMMQVLPFERLTLKGKDQRQRAISAGKSREPLTPEQQRHAAAEINALVKSGTREQTACKQLAPKYGVHYKTLKRYRRRLVVATD